MQTIKISNKSNKLIVNGTISSETLETSNINVTDDVYVNNNNFLPVGSVCVYSGQTAPNGWLICDGSAISRTTYSRLFSAINTLYGAGNGTTTFNLPNLEERIPVGKTSSTSLGNNGGNSSITLSTNQLPSHTHTGTTADSGSHSHSINDPGHAHTQVTHQDDYNEWSGNPPSFADDNGSDVTWSNINSNTTGITINSSGNHSHTFTTNSTGSGSAIDIRNKFIVMNYIIRY